MTKKHFSYLISRKTSKFQVHQLQLTLQESKNRRFILYGLYVGSMSLHLESTSPYYIELDRLPLYTVEFSFCFVCVQYSVLCSYWNKLYYIILYITQKRYKLIEIIKVQGQNPLNRTFCGEWRKLIKAKKCFSYFFIWLLCYSD